MSQIKKREEVALQMLHSNRKVKVYSINVRENFKTYFIRIDYYTLIRQALKSFNITLSESFDSQFQLSEKELLFLNNITNRNLIITSFLKIFYSRILDILYSDDIKTYPTTDLLDYDNNEIKIYNYVFINDRIKNLYDSKCFNLYKSPYSNNNIDPTVKELYNGMNNSNILKKFIPFYFGKNSRYNSSSLIDRLYLIDINNIQFKTRNIIYNTNGCFRLVKFIDYIKYNTDIIDLLLELEFYLASYKIEDMFELEEMSISLKQFKIPELYKVCTIKKGEFIFD